MTVRTSPSPAELRLLEEVGVPLKEGFEKVGDFVIHYVCAGVGSPVLLIHGANIGWAQWYPNIAKIAKHFQVYAIDLPGAGRSSTVDLRQGSLETNLVEPVEQFINAKGISRAVVLGHSVGAWVALKLALRGTSDPEGLILVNPLGFTDFVPMRYRIAANPLAFGILSRTLLRPTREGVKRFLADVLHNRECLSEDFLDYCCENAAGSHLKHPLHFVRVVLDKGHTKQELVLGDELSRIRRPVLIIHGIRDPLIPVADIEVASRRIPHALLHVMSDAGHVPPLERTHEFNEQVVKYMKSLPQSPVPT